jgi:hypothetical protein
MPLASAKTRARARPNPASPLRNGSVSTLADSFRRVPRDLVVVFPFLLTDLIKTVCDPEPACTTPSVSLHKGKYNEAEQMHRKALELWIEVFALKLSDGHR